MTSPRTPNPPRRPTQLERVNGIIADLDRIATETVDLDTADDIRSVIKLAERLRDDLGADDGGR